jgi:acetylornithine deacetylase
VIEEECTGNGALAAANRDRADAALITESTNQRFTRAHVGVAWFSVTITGRSEHAARAHRGVNAIEKSVPVIAALRRLDAELNEESHPLYAGIDHPINLNVGVMRAGDWPSTVPGEARIDCRVSFYPGGTMADLRSRIESAVAGVAATDPWLREHPPRVAYHGFGSEGSVVDVGHPFVQHVAGWHEWVTGDRIEFEAATGICDMKAFNLAGIPCGCYGTRGGNAHGAEEWLDLTSLAPTMKVVGGAILDWCGVSGAG